MQTVAGPTSPSFVQTWHAYRRPLEYLSECAERYGDYFTLRLVTFPAPITLVSDPDAIKEMYAADGTESLEAGSIAAPIMQNVLGKHSMLIIDGEEHRRHRGLIMPFFMHGQFRKFGDTILKLTDREIDRWQEGARFPIRSKTRNITLQVILNLLFGEERASSAIPPEVVREFFGLGPSLLLLVRSMQRDLGPLTPWRSFQKMRGAIYRVIASEVAHRRTHPYIIRNDVLAALVDARDENGAGLTEQEILDELLTMVLGGNDTTATALAWAIYYIYIYGDPKVCRRCAKKFSPAASVRSAS
jgi:cytochrome P450